MSPKLKAQLEGVSLLRVGAAVSAIVVIVGGITAAGDTRYAQKDSFVAYQQGEAQRDTVRFIEHAEEIKDLRRDIRDIAKTLAHSDTIATCTRLELKHKHPTMCDR